MGVGRGGGVVGDVAIRIGVTELGGVGLSGGSEKESPEKAADSLTVIHLELPQLVRGDASPRSLSIGGIPLFGYASDEGTLIGESGCDELLAGLGGFVLRELNASGAAQGNGAQGGH
jgi:hypothetical protein